MRCQVYTANKIPPYGGGKKKIKEKPSGVRNYHPAHRKVDLYRLKQHLPAQDTEYIIQGEDAEGKEKESFVCCPDGFKEALAVYLEEKQNQKDDAYGYP